MKAEEFEGRFEDGGHVLDLLDPDRARRAEQEQRRVDVDLPVRMIRSPDREARRLGVARQSLIRIVVARYLEEAKV